MLRVGKAHKMDAREQVVRGSARHAVAWVSAPCRAHGRRSDPKRLAARVRVHHRILERLLREEWDEHCEEDVVAVALTTKRVGVVGGVPSAHPHRLVAHARKLHVTHLEARLVLDLGWLGHVWMVPEPTRACAADRHRAHVLLRRRRTAHDHEPRLLDDERNHHELARRQFRQ